MEPTERREFDRTVLAKLETLGADIAEVKTTTGDLHLTLMGPKEQRWLGWIPRIEVRVGDLEKRFWLAALGVISALIGTGWALLGKH